MLIVWIGTHGVSPARLRDDMTTWLELRLKYGVPSTLLVLSNAFMYAQGKEGEIDSHYDALMAVLSSIPEELYHEMELDISSAEGAATNKQRLEVIREQQELIEQEAADHKEHKEAVEEHKEAIAETTVGEKLASGEPVNEEKVASGEPVVDEKTAQLTPAEAGTEFKAEEKK